MQRQIVVERAMQGAKGKPSPSATAIGETESAEPSNASAFLQMRRFHHQPKGTPKAQAKSRFSALPSNPKNSPVTKKSLMSPPPKPNLPVSFSNTKEVARRRTPTPNAPAKLQSTWPISTGIDVPHIHSVHSEITQITVPATMHPLGTMRARASVTLANTNTAPSAQVANIELGNSMSAT